MMLKPETEHPFILDYKGLCAFSQKASFILVYLLKLTNKPCDTLNVTKK